MAARLPPPPLPSFTRSNARVQHSLVANGSGINSSSFISSSSSSNGSLLPSTSTVIANENALNSSRSPDRNSPLSAALSVAIASGSRQSSRENGIRDIEKCGWLRFRNTGPHSDRNSSLSSSSNRPQSDNYWTMFSVLNETEPVLELFAFKQPLHRKLPDAAQRFSLLEAQHVTACINPYEHDTEHEFVITLQKYSVRLMANSHSLMQEWVEALNDKLVALEVLPPRFNIYSKEPTSAVRRNPNIASRPLPPIPTEHQVTPRSSSSSPPPRPLPSSAVVNANRIASIGRSRLSPPARPARTVNSPNRNRFFDSGPTLATNFHQLLFSFSSTPSSLSIPSRPVPARPTMQTQLSDGATVVRNRPSDVYEVTFQPHTSSLSRTRVLRSAAGLLSNNATASGSASGSSPQLSELQHSREDHLLSSSSGDLSQTLNALTIRSPLVSGSGSTGSLALINSASQSQMSALSLRESQVLRFRSEIQHRDGVRFQIRSRDLQDSLALCDWMGQVWVAGWKQRHRPQLHNAFHIGDRLLSVAGQSIISTSHAYAIFREPLQSIELIVKRTPHAQIFLIKRQYDAQDLGIERDGNGAEIVHVLPDGLAAQFGISAYASSVDSGASALCNWWITEINNRPLNLFFKRNEIRDRLNAVGREISLLLQPSDLIRQLRRQLKTFKNYKDYLVQ